jgi:hypothetical protein
MGKKTAAAKRSPAVKANQRKGSSPRKGGAFPNVNEMVSAGSSRGPDIRDMQVDDDVNLYITKYSSDGSKYDDAFLSEDLLMVLHVTSLRPSPLYFMKKLIESMGEDRKGTDDPPPKSLDELKIQYYASFQYVSKKTVDVDQVGFAANASGFFVSKSGLKDFLMYYDDLMDYRFRDAVGDDFEALPKAPKLIIHIADDSLKVDINSEVDQMACEFDLKNSSSTVDGGRISGQ